MANPVEGRIIVEVTRKHIVLYQCDAKGLVTDQDVFSWGFMLDRKDAVDEVTSTYGYLYDFLNHVINGEDDDESDTEVDGPDRSARDGESPSESE